MAKGEGEGVAPREPMSRVDTAWLRMERPTNLMMITGVLMFSAPLQHARLRELIEERFLAWRRFRQKAVDTPAGAWWEDDAALDLDHHVRTMALPGKGGKKALQKLVSLLASTPLEAGRPLWQFHLVEHYDGGSALVARIHHCYADGMALVQVLLSLTDTSPETRPATALPRAWLKHDGEQVARRLLDPARAGLDRAMKLGGKALQKGVELYQNPSLAAVLAMEGGAIARELAYALSLPDDPPTRLKRPLGVSKRTAWAEPLPLEEVKAVGKALGCTVNDVLLASATGALRAFLREDGGDCAGVTVRATVPVNLRPLEHARKLGNHFGLVFLELPVGEANPLRRLEHIAGCMRELKSSRQAAATFGALAALGMAPPPLQRAALELFSRKASAVATNVPGPQVPLYLAGAPIRELMFWVPQTGSVGIGVSILSYNGSVHFGLIADARCIPDPDAVIRHFRGEFEKLLYATLLEDWSAPITPSGAEATLQRYAAAPPASSSRPRTAAARGRRRSSRSA